jgi:hypothetical protein
MLKCKEMEIGVEQIGGMARYIRARAFSHFYAFAPSAFFSLRACIARKNMRYGGGAALRLEGEW